MKKQLSLKLILTFLVLAMLAGITLYFGNPNIAKDAGKVQIKVVDLDGTIVKNQTIKFKETDSLVSIIEDNFANVKLENGMLYDIETLKTPADWSSFICIYVNDQMSMVGIYDIPLVDGDVISLVMTPLETNYNE